MFCVIIPYSTICQTASELAFNTIRPHRENAQKAKSKQENVDERQQCDWWSHIVVNSDLNPRQSLGMSD